MLKLAAESVWNQVKDGCAYSYRGLPIPDPELSRSPQPNRHKLPHGSSIVAKSVFGGLHHEYKEKATTWTSKLDSTSRERDRIVLLAELLDLGCQGCLWFVKTLRILS